MTFLTQEPTPFLFLAMTFVTREKVVGQKRLFEISFGTAAATPAAGRFFGTALAVPAAIAPAAPAPTTSFSLGNAGGLFGSISAPPSCSFGAFTQPAAASPASAAPAAAAPLFSFVSLAPVTPAIPSTAFSFGAAAAAPAAGGLFGAAPASVPAAPTTAFSFGTAATAPASGGLFRSALVIAPTASTKSLSFETSSLPLHVASQNGNLAEVVALLEQGADVAAPKLVILCAHPSK